MLRYLITPLFGLLLLLTSACQKKTPEPIPPVSEAWATYKDEKGVTTSLSHVGGIIRNTSTYTGGNVVVYHSVFLRGWLADRTFIDVSYSVASPLAFPATTGPVTLDHIVVVHGGAPLGSNATVFYPAVTTGQLTVDELSPKTVSATYTGPLLDYSPDVKLVFHKVNITENFTSEP